MERILVIICYLLTISVIAALFYGFMHMPQEARDQIIMQQSNP